MWPLAAHAQQSAMPVIGLLSGNRFEEHELPPAAIGAEVGFIEGRNFAVEYRSAEGQYSRLPTLAAELVRRPLRPCRSVKAKTDRVSPLAAMCQNRP